MQRFGAALHQRQNQTQTPEFKAWFKNSKVVDASGQPLVVYHGMKGSMEGDAFRTGNSENSSMIFFTTNQEMASAYAGEGTVFPCYLSLQNPFIKDYKGEASYEFQDEYDEAVAGGHDGMIFLNLVDYKDDEPMDQYVAFAPEQVKSVFNRGGWSSDTANLSQARQTTLIGYHGTEEPIEVQDLQPYVGGFGWGIYFTNNKEEASDYGHIILEAEIRWKNPIRTVGNYTEGEELDIDAAFVPLIKQVYKEDWPVQLQKLKGTVDTPPSDMFDRIKNLGHDGIEVVWSNGTDRWYIVFNSQDISPHQENQA